MSGMDLPMMDRDLLNACFWTARNLFPLNSLPEQQLIPILSVLGGLTQFQCIKNYISHIYDQPHIFVLFEVGCLLWLLKRKVQNPYRLFYPILSRRLQPYQTSLAHQSSSIIKSYHKSRISTYRLSRIYHPHATLMPFYSGLQSLYSEEFMVSNVCFVPFSTQSLTL